MRETEAARPSSIVYDDTPIHVYMSRIHARLMKSGRLSFHDLFEPGMHKSKLVGIFLAVLELVRHHHVRVEQNALFGEIWILPDPSSTGPWICRTWTSTSMRRVRIRGQRGTPICNLQSVISNLKSRIPDLA